MWSEEEEKPASNPRKNLEEMSIEALETYIVELEREIERAKTTIAFKKEVRGSASALFNS